MVYQAKRGILFLSQVYRIAREGVLNSKGFEPLRAVGIVPACKSRETGFSKPAHMEILNSDGFCLSTIEVDQCALQQPGFRGQNEDG